VRLRTLLIASTAALIVLVLGAAVMLLVVANVGRGGAAYILISVRSVEVAQQLRLDVAKLRAGGSERSVDNRAIDSNLDLAAALVQSNRESHVVERLRTAVDALRGAVAQRPGARPLIEAADEADRAAEELVAVNVEQAHKAESQVREQTKAAAAWAGAAAAALVLGLLSIVAWTRARVLRPLALLRDRIESVALGGPESNVPEKAPEELRAVADTFDAMAAAVGNHRLDRLELLGRVASAMAAPLNKMLQVTDGLSPEGTLPRERDLRAAISTMGRELIRLRRVLDEYLEAARIEEGILDLERGAVDLAGLISESVELFQPLAPTTKIQLSVSGGTLVRGDARRLAQVINNLLAIAVRHASDFGRVHVELQRGATNQVLEIAVSSVSGASFERLYNALHGLDQAILGVPGTGFTIHTSRRIIEALGGQLDVERREEGVAMRVVLPSTAAPTEVKAAS